MPNSKREVMGEWAEVVDELPPEDALSGVTRGSSRTLETARLVLIDVVITAVVFVVITLEVEVEAEVEGGGEGKMEGIVSCGKLAGIVPLSLDCCERIPEEAVDGLTGLSLCGEDAFVRGMARAEPEDETVVSGSKGTCCVCGRDEWEAFGVVASVRTDVLSPKAAGLVCNSDDC